MKTKDFLKLHCQQISENEYIRYRPISSTNKNNSILHYLKIRCSNCNEICYTNKRKNMKLLFCGMGCTMNYYFKKKDPKQTQMMSLINTPEFFYLIGLITTDGMVLYPDIKYITKNKYHVASIELGKKDKTVLRDIQHLFGGKTYKTHNNTACKLEFRNKDFVNYLKNNVGLTPKKSLTLNINTSWFNDLTREQQNNFLRGCYDGDGSIVRNKKKHVHRPFTGIEIVTCSKKFKTFLSNIFIQRGFQPKYITYIPKTPNRHTSYKINFYGKNAITPLNEIFACTSSICLKRKTIRYIEYKNYYIN